MMAPYVKSRPDDARISSHHTATIMAPDTMAAFDDNPEMHHGSESGSLHARLAAQKNRLFAANFAHFYRRTEQVSLAVSLSYSNLRC
jgi:hypothetical protein